MSANNLATKIADLPIMLPAHVLARLAEHDIHTLDDWRGLSRRRYQLWGVTRRMVAQIDAAARVRV